RTGRGASGRSGCRHRPCLCRAGSPCAGSGCRARTPLRDRRQLESACDGHGQPTGPHLRAHPACPRTRNPPFHLPITPPRICRRRATSFPQEGRSPGTWAMLSPALIKLCPRYPSSICSRAAGTLSQNRARAHAIYDGRDLESAQRVLDGDKRLSATPDDVEEMPKLPFEGLRRLRPQRLLDDLAVPSRLAFVAPELELR